MARTDRPSLPRRSRLAFRGHPTSHEGPPDLPAAIESLNDPAMSKLEGKIALVTGANSGIGLASAKRFVREGAYVFITGRRDRELAAAVREIGRKVIGVQGDVANLADLDRLFAQIKREKGRLDIVFANAGTARLALLGKISEEQYDAVFDVNVKGLLFTVQKALTLMPDSGAIILFRTMRWLPSRLRLRIATCSQASSSGHSRR